MKILVIDGQGGRIGRQLCEGICERFPESELFAVGTNSMATMSMSKGGAKNVATGENAVVVNARRADVIIGPVGIVITDALMGEVSEKMAAAVGRSEALRILIPVAKCSTVIAGTYDMSISDLVADALNKLSEHIDSISSIW